MKRENSKKGVTCLTDDAALTKLVISCRMNFTRIAALVTALICVVSGAPVDVRDAKDANSAAPDPLVSATHRALPNTAANTSIK